MELETFLTKEYIDQYQIFWPYKTILDYLNKSIKKCPDKTAIVDKNSRYTFEELGKMVDRVALGLMEYGIEKGDVISLQLPNWNEFVILHYAATRIGAITNPLAPIYRDREIKYMLNMTESKLIVIPNIFRNFNYPEMIQRLRNNWPKLKNIFVTGEEIPKGMQPLSYLFEEPWEEKYNVTILDSVNIDPDEVTEIIFTSGTTGNPKGVMHTHNTLCVSANYWIDRLQLSNDDVMFMASTFAHQTGFGYGVRLPTHLGITAVYQDVWDPHEFIELIKEEQITFTASATPFLQDMIGVDGIENEDIHSFRAFVSLGAPIPRPLVKQAKDKVDFKIISGWGQTENGLVTLTGLNDADEKITGTDGYPFSGMEIKVVDENGNKCPCEIEGSLLVRGPAQFVGYIKQMDLAESEHNKKGWFITGDRATVDQDGYVRITGRNKDVIIRGGENIPVAYLENVFHEHPDIAEAQIVAMPDKRFQEKACAFVSLNSEKNELTFRDMQKYLENEGIAKQYWPEHLEVINEFPRTPSGKIQKFKLREWIQKKIKDARL